MKCQNGTHNLRHGVAMSLNPLGWYL